jgi:hypothetical protein
MPVTCPRCSSALRPAETFCHHCGKELDAETIAQSGRDNARDAASARNGNGDGPYMEIGGVGRRSRIIGGIAYVLLFGTVCAILVALFVRFTGNIRLAIVLVVFMVSYMVLMGWWASRGASR